MRAIPFLRFGALVLSMAVAAAAHAAATFPQEGVWRGEFSVDGDPIPFNFEVKGHDAKDARFGELKSRLEPKLSCTAIPRAKPLGAGSLHLPWSAAAFSTAAWRGLSASSDSRNASGSAPAAAASSSMKLSTMKPEKLCPTERQ